MKHCLILMLLLACAPAFAHKPSDSYLSLNSASSSPQITGRWDIALRDLQLVIDLDSNNDGNITWGELRNRQPELAQQILPMLTVQTGQGETAQPCPLTLTGLQANDHVDGTYAALHFQGTCPAAPSQLGVHYRFLFDRDPSHHGLLKSNHDGVELAVTFSDNQRRHQLDTSGAGQWQAFQGFVHQGIHHILIGYDHILFLLTLLFPAVLVWQRGGWQPAPTMRGALTQTLAIVTAFTVTHSLTLALASLGLVNLPSWLLESAIAITVGLGALSNLAPRYFPRRWVMALVFGLIHGLGFAAVLADLGLDGGSLVLTLLGFNLGVEAGQALIVVVFVPAAFLVRRTAAYRRWFVPIGSVAIIAIATVWAVDRLSGAL